MHAIIDKFAERGLRSLGVARQEVPAGTKDSPGGPWEFVGLLPLFDPPRHDSAETIRRALDLGVSVKMITGRKYLICFTKKSVMAYVMIKMIYNSKMETFCYR